MTFAIWSMDIYVCLHLKEVNMSKQKLKNYHFVGILVFANVAFLVKAVDLDPQCHLTHVYSWIIWCLNTAASCL